jgi:cell division protein FtsQ
MAVYQRLLGELDANGQRISEQISEIDLTDPEDAKVLMPEQGSDVLAHFGEDRFLERYQRYKAHINEWRQHYPKLASVDLRYDQQVVLEMSTSTNVAQAAADEQAATNAAEGKQAAPEAAGKEKAAGKVTAKKHSGAKAPVDSASSGVKDSAKTKASTSQAPAHQPGPAVKVKPGKKDAKPAGNGSAKTKAPAAKDKAAKAKVVPKTVKTNVKKKKYAAEVKRAALKINKRKIAASARPAAIAGEGQ